MEYIVKKSTMERYDIRVKGEEHWRCAWAIIGISEDGLLTAHTDCGNFSYHFQPGGSFKEFLIEVCSNDDSYLYTKLKTESYKVDVERTIAAMKECVISVRRDSDCTEKEARHLWGDLEIVLASADDNRAEQTYFANLIEEHVDEDILRSVIGCDWYEYIRFAEDRAAKSFCEVVAPIFAEILKQEQVNKTVV